MAAGINSRVSDLTAVLRNVIDRLRRLESPKTLRLGPAGSSGGSSTPGWTFSVDVDGNLIVTPDGGDPRILESP